MFEWVCSRLKLTHGVRFKEYEIRKSVKQVALRWATVLTEDEKKKIARTLGGNRYALSAQAILEEVFSAIADSESTDDTV